MKAEPGGMCDNFCFQFPLYYQAEAKVFQTTPKGNFFQGAKMCVISFFRKTGDCEKRYLEVMTDSYYIDFNTKKIAFYRPWRLDWSESEYETISTIFEKGFVYIKVVD